MGQANVSELLQEGIGSIQEYALDEKATIAGGQSHLRGEITLIRTDRGVLVRGVVASEIRLTCSRCLAESRLPIMLNIAEEYLPVTDLQSGAALPEPEGPANFKIDEHHVIDLTEAIRQYAEMKIPMKPLCRDNCAGLCPSCGKNLNEDNCNCRGQETDPRWAALLKARAAGKEKKA